MRYFDHDTTASKDDRIIDLRCRFGSAAVDAYWALIEKIYLEEAPVNRQETNPVSVWLKLGFDELQTYIDGMISVGLLETVENDENLLVSVRAMANIEAYNAKCETARQNGKKGGRKPTGNQSALRAVSGRKAGAKLRKEKKGIGFDKQNQIPAVGGAGAGEPAPLHGETGRWACPVCDSTAYPNASTGAWSCPKHADIPQAVWVPDSVGTPCPPEIAARFAEVRHVDA